MPQEHSRLPARCGMPSVSVGKLRRAVMNGVPIDQVPCHGIVDIHLVRGVRRGLPPPMTHIWPLKLSARVSPVALGMLAMGRYIRHRVIDKGVRSVGEKAGRECCRHL